MQEVSLNFVSKKYEPTVRLDDVMMKNVSPYEALPVYPVPQLWGSGQLFGPVVLIAEPQNTMNKNSGHE
jgi:hypothetical protein